MTEIVRYGILDGVTGYIKGLFMSENEAITNLNYLEGCTIVKLVGQMPEPQKMKKVATFVYQKDDPAEVWESRLLRTEDEAKGICEQNGWKLLKWPNCDVLEVES